MQTRSSNFTRAALHALGLAALVFAVAGCAERAQQKQSDFSTSGSKMSGRARIEEIRSMGQSFADSYVTRMASLVDATLPQAKTASERALIHQVKVLAAIGAYTAAVEPNPIIGVADLTAFVTLRRMAAEQYFAEHPIGSEEFRRFAIEQFAEGEREAWEMMARISSPEQVKQLRNAITSWRDRNPQSVRFMLLRLGEFSAYRRIETAAAGSSVPSNLLQWLYLDPMSSLDPATRQIEETRRLAARGIYYGERMPMLLAWETRQAFLDIVASDEAQALLQRTDVVANAFDRTSKTVEQFPAVIASERQTILDNFWKNIASERETILDNFWKNLRSEREATVANLSTAMQANVDTWLKQSAEAVRIEREAAIKQMSETIRLEREALLHDLSARSPLDQPIAAADTAAQQRIDQAYARTLRLVIIVLVGLPVSLLLYRLVSRIAAPRSPTR